MRVPIALTIFLLLFACNKPQTIDSKKKTVETIKPDSVKDIPKENKKNNKDNSWQQGFGLTHDDDKDTIWNRPVRFYIEDKNCSQLAKDFYFGNKRPTDDEETEKLLNLIITDNKNLRPFYRWILNKTILIQDGALAEYTGQPARRYAEKFPNEFFDYMDFDKSGDKYLDWCNSILYSGFYDTDDWRKPKEIREGMIKAMIKNCVNYNEKYKKRIEKLAFDCFSDSIQN